MDKTRHHKFFGLKDVSVSDSFWKPFLDRVRTQVIPYQWDALNDKVPGAEPSYSMRNFKLAAQITHPELDYGVPADAGHGGFIFQDSDFAKWVEAAAYTLFWHPDPELEKIIDGGIELVCQAQQEDGYLNTHFIIKGLEKRFTNLKDAHELYCFGHFLEAAIAYYEATGKRKLLDAIIRYAECIESCIGKEEGKLRGYPGHEIAEMALVRLYEITKDERHLRLAKYFIDERGQSPLYFAEENRLHNNNFYWHDSHFQYQYYQAGRPVREQFAGEGHAVRAVYLYSGMADTARLTGDDELSLVCKKIWDNIVNRQLYITGAIGQSSYGESFSYDYDLPNDTVYGETCASIGLAFFAQRMASLLPAGCPQGVFGDVMEKTLYNGIISGMSLDGKAFFYVNPLEVIPEACEKDRRMRHVKAERQKWFSCACCPPNLARIIASLGSYIHSYNGEENTLITHLYIGSELNCMVDMGKILSLKTETNYPWDGEVKIKFSLKESAGFKYGFRIPAWCKNFTLSLNGKNFSGYNLSNGIAYIEREWADGDTISLMLDMPAVFIRSNPRVRVNSGKIALMRGPIVYCLEEIDNGNDLHKLSGGGRKEPTGVKISYEKDLLEGVNRISLTGKRIKDWNEDLLYDTEEPVTEERELIFIPYYAWANRKTGEMRVWFNE